MTISSTTRKAGPFTGTGLQTVFPFTFKVFATSDLLAVQAVTATGAETVKVLTTDYTVALNANQNLNPGGNLTMIVAPPVGTTLTLSSQVPNLQGTDLTNGGGFYPQVITDALDRATIQIQQIAASVGRALGLGISAPANVSTQLPYPVANSFLGWDSLGLSIQNYAGLASAAVSTYMATVVAAVNAAAARAALGASAVGEAVFTAASAALARVALGAAASGANADITSTSALTAMTNLTLLDGSSPLATGAWQTVISGPVDANGQAAFGGATGATTVTAAGTIITSAANGFGAAGAINYVASSVNPQWTGLSTNGTMFLYEDTNPATLVKTQGAGTLAPSYIGGGVPSTTNGQFTFDYTKRIGYVGNGAAAVQTNRVYVGEVTVAANVVSAIVWYALNGRYDSGYTNTLPALSTATSRNHNLGVVPRRAELWIKCLTADGGYSVGDELNNVNQSNGTFYMSTQIASTRLAMKYASGSSGHAATTYSSGGGSNLTAANWAYRLSADRGW